MMQGERDTVECIGKGPGCGIVLHAYTQTENEREREKGKDTHTLAYWCAKITTLYASVCVR